IAPKKKAQKISLNEFLGDSGKQTIPANRYMLHYFCPPLGSWADEMDSLPSAPAVRTDEERARGNDRYGRGGDDFLSSRPDRVSGPPREDLPLPTQPPYTAFVGNLAFDLTEIDLEEFFAGQKTKSIKIIKDRDEKPKGFGYVEFEQLEGLKEALAKSGTNLSSRTVRVSVAEPRSSQALGIMTGGFGGFEDEAKFDNPWRRDGPLPDLPGAGDRDRPQRRFDGPGAGAPPSVTEGVDQWRSSRPARAPASPDSEPPRRKGTGFSTPEGQVGMADTEEKWSKGSKFTPSANEDNAGSKFGGGFKGRSEMAPPRDPPASSAAEGEIDWRSSSRPRPVTRGSTSPSNSTPPTPQLTRRKLELIPRANSGSASPSPLSSPKLANSTAASSRSNPFGAARPVDVSTREKEVAERLEKDRETTKDRLASHTMSRTNSRTASLRTGTPPPSATKTPPTPASPKLPHAVASTVRPAVSFASAAAAKR
ncbi:RNA-binding domain-containing protein, partial [Athelia psychrophila]